MYHVSQSCLLPKKTEPSLLFFDLLVSCDELWTLLKFYFLGYNCSIFLPGLAYSFLSLESLQNVLKFCSHLLENQLRFRSPKTGFSCQRKFEAIRIRFLVCPFFQFAANRAKNLTSFFSENRYYRSGSRPRILE